MHYIAKANKSVTITKLISDAKVKFDWHIDPLTLASQFLRVKDFKDYPKLLVPFSEQKMEDFFIAEAKKLKSKILS